MKHLKHFENLDMLRDYGLLLSDDKFQKLSNDFDKLVDYFLEIADKKLKFSTAYGREVIMKYEDYLSQNEKYKEFIHGLAFDHKNKGVPEFTAVISIEFDYNESIVIQNKFKTIIRRLELDDWSLTEFKNLSSKRFNNMNLSFTFKKGKYFTFDT